MTFNEWMCINFDDCDKGYVTISDVLPFLIGLSSIIFFVIFYCNGAYIVYNDMADIKNGIGNNTIHVSEYLSFNEFFTVAWFIIGTTVIGIYILYVFLIYICSKKIVVCKRR